MFTRIVQEVETAVAGRSLLSPKKFLESLADVLFIPLSPGRIRGASFVSSADRPVVVIDAGLSWRERDGVCLHEGAHIILHPWANRLFLQSATLFVPSRYEAEADIFALAYLLKWNPDWFEDSGWDAGRFASMYGLDKAVAYANGIVDEVLKKEGTGNGWLG